MKRVVVILGVLALMAVAAVAIAGPDSGPVSDPVGVLQCAKDEEVSVRDFLYSADEPGFSDPREALAALLSPLERFDASSSGMIEAEATDAEQLVTLENQDPAVAGIGLAARMVKTGQGGWVLEELAACDSALEALGPPTLPEVS